MNVEDDNIRIQVETVSLWIDKIPGSIERLLRVNMMVKRCSVKDPNFKEQKSYKLYLPKGSIYKPY